MANESIQDTEVAGLKSSFEGYVNDIKGIGDFTHVLSLRPTQIDIVCKFQISATYPLDPPAISVRSSVLSADETTGLAVFLQSAAQALIGQPMVQELMQKGLEWCVDNGISGDKEKSEQNDRKKGKYKKRSKGSKVKAEDTQTEEKEMNEKKPPMKTAADVIKRLQWDPDVNKEDFIVGYMDRLVGLQEREFTAFTWEDLASVDQFALAIPQHRIQYFKYKTAKVWDKNTRQDDVFGSTGSRITILEAIAKYEASVDQQKGNDDITLTVDELATGEGAVCDEMIGEFEEKSEQEDPETFSKTDTNVNCDSNDAKEKDTKTSTRLPRKRGKDSNYFLALQIKDEELIKNLVDVQRQVVEMYPVYKDYMINRNGFHITLRLLNLANDDDIRTSAAVIKAVRDQVIDYMHKIEPLNFQGLDHFGPKVVYVKVKSTTAFRDLIESLSARLLDAGVNVLTQHLVPHLTLFKVPKSASREMSTEPPILLRFNDTYFGSQPLDNIHLCQMGTLTETSDFYTTAASIVIQE